MTRLLACVDCGKLVSPGPRCFDCRRTRSAIYNASRPQHHAFYATSAWRRLSLEVRKGATRCHWCLKPTRKLVADHVIPLEDRPDLALERSNLVASCVPCNTRRGRNAKVPDLPSVAVTRPDTPTRAREASEVGAITASPPLSPGG
jgi:5-methylcytosine-specific restriction endonuclease McrA